MKNIKLHDYKIFKKDLAHFGSKFQFSIMQIFIVEMHIPNNKGGYLGRVTAFKLLCRKKELKKFHIMVK